MTTKASVEAVDVFKLPRSEKAPDLLAVEEPLEMRLWYGNLTNRKKTTISITMRTPGHDFELALGFLFSEGIVQSLQDVKTIRFCEEIDQPEALNNIVIVELKPDVSFNAEHLQRNFYTTSSCGICGKASIDAVSQLCSQLPNSQQQLPLSTLYALPQLLREKQVAFKSTGGIHAAALFNYQGELILLREDVGRHNAVDKLVGAALHEVLLPATDKVLMLSGRMSFELIQKAVLAGFSIVAAVGAPSSLAISTARSFNLTTVGFLRQPKGNVYSVANRIAFDH